MQEWIVVGWVIVVTVVGLNDFAAGVAAMLHAWRSELRPGSRTLLAGTMAAILPTSFFIVVPLAEDWRSWESGWLLALAAVLGVGALVSLPGASIVTRKLEAPRGEYRTFE